VIGVSRTAFGLMVRRPVRRNHHPSTSPAVGL
jgi:hypothetical protein